MKNGTRRYEGWGINMLELSMGYMFIVVTTSQL